MKVLIKLILIAIGVLGLAGLGQANDEVPDHKFDDRGFEKMLFKSSTCIGGYGTPNWTCKPVETPGYLLRAKNGDKSALVFISHGTQGLDSRHGEYAKYLAENGINAMVMGHWRGRDIGLVHKDYVRWQKLGGTAMNEAIDVLYAASQIKEMPEWTEAKIGHMGESMGGSAALNLTKPYLRRAYADLNGHPPVLLNALVALYPGCFDRDAKEAFVRTPLLILTGATDNDTPAATCESLKSHMNSRGGDTTHISLEGQGHDFDGPYTYYQAGGAQNPQKCANMHANGLYTLDANGQSFADYGEMMRACIGLSNERVWAGNKGNPRTGYDQWLSYLKSKLLVPQR